MKITHKKLWAGGSIVAVLVSLAFQQTLAHYQERETTLELTNARLHERLFIEIMRSELGRSLAGTTYTVTPSGGAMVSGKGFSFTSICDINFREIVDAVQVREVATKLSNHNEIANWQSLAAQQQTSRFCQFLVVNKAERPYIRMVMHESNPPTGLAEADLLKVFNEGESSPAATPEAANQP
ncbi:MAG: hypothetical protein EOP85_12920 [Verrucomicrobiaceae bacterium]|nr:MAG: hypothetical protein EOP85_12920 [Verrucomicrobiaceae bacterium]